MPGYVYKGTNFDVPATPKPLVRRAFDPTACGTYRGYKQHLRHGQTACRICKDACAENMAERRRRAEENDDKSGFDPGKCGTVKGYSQHRNYAVPACDDCRQANADNCRERREKAKANKQ